MIGAGSIGFTRQLTHDIVSVPELADTVFVFHDIDARNLEMVARLCRRDLAASEIPALIETTADVRAAVADADYVICLIRQGGLEAFRTDIEIPLRYGVDQCVGDTLGPGGIFYAQRTIPALLGFCRHIREVAKPGALFLNYSNPMAMNTWACNQYGGVPTVGLCHGVQGAHWQIAACIEQWARRTRRIGPTESVSRHDVDVIAAGINHQTWFVRVNWRGEEMLPRLLGEFERHPDYAKTEKVRIDVLRRFGFYSTESNGHLSEYLPWYRKRPGEIKNWIDLSSWIHGETGGYLRVCTEGRNWFKSDFPSWMKETPPTLPLTRRSEEHGSWIIEALETGRTYRGHFNVINRGHIPNLPDGCVVEIPGFVDRSGIQMPVTGPLPLACAATCSASVRVQEMSVEAAVHGDIMLLRQAILHDPLTAAVCNPEEIWQMTDEMLVAQAEWLPQFRSETGGAKKRLSAHTAAGTRVKLRAGRGAARLDVRGLKELARDRGAARANAAAADKGRMTRNRTSAGSQKATSSR